MAGPEQPHKVGGIIDVRPTGDVGPTGPYSEKIRKGNAILDSLLDPKYEIFAIEAGLSYQDLLKNHTRKEARKIVFERLMKVRQSKAPPEVPDRNERKDTGALRSPLKIKWK